MEAPTTHSPGGAASKAGAAGGEDDTGRASGTPGAAGPGVVPCKWATCTAQFDSNDQLLPHISTLHLTANHMGRGLAPPAGAPPVVRTAAAEHAQAAEAAPPAPTAPSLANLLDPDSEEYALVAIAQPPAGSPLPTTSPGGAPPHAGGSLVCKWNPCGPRTFASFDDLFRHVSHEHIALEGESLERPHGCLWAGCRERFAAFEGLTTHLSTVHIGNGQHSYVCEWAGCERNGRPFAQRQKIMRHVQTHTGDKPYQCTTCLQRFSEQSVMTQHQRLHTGEKPFVCPDASCQKQFALPSALTVHPFECKAEGCNKRFSDSSNLTKHVRVHTGEKPFRCPIELCSKTFARPDQASRHTRVHRGSST
ncbi:hypothetical protein HK105_208687 [Polyrhizophydium stewartii]|uniref:C2H2-type domain-containing protein n=1 Tax=Polyrhizophydium stewartii TaxID=2732419 RepID=A0ABR4MX43_9FUNG